MKKTQKRLEEFCKKWSLSDTHLIELNEILKEHEDRRHCEGAVMIPVPEECELILVGYLKGNEILKAITVEAQNNEIHECEEEECSQS